MVDTYLATSLNLVEPGHQPILTWAGPTCTLGDDHEKGIRGPYQKHALPVSDARVHLKNGGVYDLVKARRLLKRFRIKALLNEVPIFFLQKICIIW